MIIDKQNVGAFSDDTGSSATVFYCFTWRTNQLLLLNIFFSFSSGFYTHQLDSWFLFVLILESSVIYQLANLFPNFWLFLVLLWMQWMLVTVNKTCHVPHASQITTWRKILTEVFVGVSKEWVRSWSHASVMTNVKKLAKKLLSVRPKTALGIRKRKKRMAITKRFAPYANTITKIT